MNKQEAAISARVNRWFSLVVPHSCPWEIKHTRGERKFKLSEIKNHQWDYLLAATTERGCTYKIVDLGPTNPPFDVLHYKNNSAYMIIVFPTMVYAVEIRQLDAYRDEKRVLDERNIDLISLFRTSVATLPR